MPLWAPSAAIDPQERRPRHDSDRGCGVDRGEAAPTGELPTAIAAGGRFLPRPAACPDEGREGLTSSPPEPCRAVRPHTALQRWLASSGLARPLPGCG